MIVYLSFPKGHSVNHRIAPRLLSLAYALVDNAVSQVLQLCVGTLLVKIDLRNAYCIVPVHPADVSSPSDDMGRGLVCGQIAALQRPMRWHGQSRLCHDVNRHIQYLDDFLLFAQMKVNQFYRLS